MRGQHLVYKPVFLRFYHPGNMFIFYIAGHEVRIIQLTLRIG